MVALRHRWVCSVSAFASESSSMVGRWVNSISMTVWQLLQTTMLITGFFGGVAAPAALFRLFFGLSFAVYTKKLSGCLVGGSLSAGPLPFIYSISGE